MPEENAALGVVDAGPVASEEVNAEESATAETSTKVGDNEDPQAPAKETGEKENEEQKRRGGWQRQRDKARKEAETARKEADYWKQQVIGNQPKQVEAKPAEKKEPKPQDFQIEGTDQYDVAAFSRAVARYEAEQVAEERDKQRQEAETRKQAESEQQKVVREYQERTTKVAEKIKDFDEKSEICLDTLQELAPDVATAPPGARLIGDAILRYDPDGQLEYYLGSHPEEIERIAALDHTAASLELGKLFSKLATESTKTEQDEADDEEEAPAPVVTKAPPPLTPARKSSPAARPFDPSDPRNDKDMTFEEWNKRDTERRRKR